MIFGVLPRSLHYGSQTPRASSRDDGEEDYAFRSEATTLTHQEWGTLMMIDPYWLERKEHSQEWLCYMRTRRRCD